MKKFIALLVVLAMVFAVTACGGSSTTATSSTPAASTSTAAPAATTPAAAPEDDFEPITIILADPNSETDLGTIYGKKATERVTELTDGKVTFEYKDAGQLGSYEETTESMSIGQLEMARLDLSYMGSYSAESQLLFLPFLTSSYDHFKKILDSEYVDNIEADLAAQNIHVIDYTASGFRSLCTKKLVTKPADCEGILLRSPGAQIYIDTLSRLGFSPVTISFNELYTALQSGICDGAEPAVVVIHDSELYKMCPYVLHANHMFSFTSFCMSQELWDTLPADIQAAFEQAFAEMRDEEFVAYEAEEQKYYDRMEADGATISNWDDWNELVDLFKPYWAETTDKMGGWSADFVQNCIDLL